MAKIKPAGKSLKSPKLPVGRSSLSPLPASSNAFAFNPNAGFNPDSENEEELDEQAMAAQLSQNKQQRRNQIKKETGQAAKKVGQKLGAEAGTAVGGPIGGLAGRFIGGQTAKMAGKKIGGKTADLTEDTGIDAGNESAQAGALNLKKNAAINANKQNGNGGLTGALAGEATSQLKKRLLWYLLPSVPVALFWLVIGLGVGLILFCFISVYNCTQKKGMAWTILNTYQGGFTELLRESFSNTCLPDTTAKQPTDTTTESDANSSNQATNANDSNPKTNQAGGQ